MPLLHQVIHAFKGLVALGGALLLIQPRRSGWLAALPPNAVRATALASLGLAAVVAWTNLGYFHYARIVHPHDMPHNYLGAKYSRELGYTELYRCAARAEAELGTPPSSYTAWARDLRTNQLAPIADLQESAGRCGQFTETRWAAFVEDVRRLRKRVKGDQRSEFYNDHGFNASPVGLVPARWLTTWLPTTGTGLAFIAVVDWLVLAAAAALIAWAFGWRVLVVALVWWGTCYATRYHFTGGGVLRNDWLLLTVAAIALVRRGHLPAGGVAIAWATLVKIFPGVLGLGLVFHELGRLWQRRALVPSRAVLRVGLGGALAIALLVPVANYTATGHAADLAPWQSYQANTERLLQGPFTNRIGLKAVLAWRPSSRMAEVRDLWLDAPGDMWRAQQWQNVAELRWVFWVLVAAFLALLARASVRHERWVAMVLSLGLIPVGLDSSARYYGFMAAYAFLWPLAPWAGPALCALSFGTLAAPILLRSDDDTYALVSLLVVAFVFAVTAAFAFGRPAAARDDDQRT